MAVHVLFFGATADAVGRRKISIEFAGEERARACFDQLIAQYPELSKHRLLFALNQQYVQGDETVRDGDELAVFTAVSGG